MRYVLNKDFRLRGYHQLPTGLFNMRRMDTVFFPREEYRVLLNCDGIHDFAPGELSDAQDRFLAKLLEDGLVHPAVWGEVLLPEQVYKLYPTEYRRHCHWSITGNCNMRCRHCFMSAPGGKHRTPSWEEIVNIADQLAECGVHQVGITGGEPLIRNDFTRLLDLMWDREIGVSVIYTNGWLVSEELLDALEARRMHPAFQLSFDGVGEHDFLRGVEGAEERTIRALKLLQERDYKVSVSMCLHRKNLPVIRRTVRRMAELGVRSMKISPAMELGDWADPELMDLHLTQAEVIEAVCAYIPEYFEDDAPLSLMMSGHFAFDRAKNEWSIHNETPCPAGDEAQMPVCGVLRTGFYISAEGRVVPCMAMDDSPFAAHFLNLFEEPLREILEDPRFTKYTAMTVKTVRDANPKCRSCRFADRCIGGCRNSVLVACGEYDGVDPELCEFFENGWDARIRAVAEPAYKEYMKRHPERRSEPVFGDLECLG